MWFKTLFFCLKNAREFIWKSNNSFLNFNNEFAKKVEYLNLTTLLRPINISKYKTSFYTEVQNYILLSIWYLHTRRSQFCNPAKIYVTICCYVHSIRSPPIRKLHEVIRQNLKVVLILPIKTKQNIRTDFVLFHYCIWLI